MHAAIRNLILLHKDVYLYLFSTNSFPLTLTATPKKGGSNIELGESREIDEDKHPIPPILESSQEGSDDTRKSLSSNVSPTNIPVSTDESHQRVSNQDATPKL